MIPKPDKPKWNGPYEGGITQSLMIRFEECPFRFYLYTYCGLQDPEPPQENLIWGDTFHKGLEHLVKGDTLHNSMQAMYDYHMKEYPLAPSTYIYTCMQMLKLFPISEYNHWDKSKIVTEHKLMEKIGAVIFRGKTDVTDFTYMSDHKCKGSIDPLGTQEELGTDLQMNLYGYILNCQHWQYDLIRIPESKYSGAPERRPGETPEAYAHRIFNTYNFPDKGYPINSFKFLWISCVPYTQPRHLNELYFKTTIRPLAERMERWWEKVNDPNFDPNNPACYDADFYIKPARMFDPTRTDKFKSHFHGILTGVQGYCDLVPVESFYSELETV